MFRLMKTKFIIIFTVLIFYLNNRCFGQWNLIYQDTTYAHMEMQFLNPDTGFIVGINMTNGTGGSIFKTNDGGNSWNILNTSAGNFTVKFPTTNVGYTGGHDGSVLKTVDMGNTWNDMPSWCCNDYSNSYFFNNDTGFVVWWGGEIVKTINGSNSWTMDTSIGGSSPFPGLGSIQFMTDSIGIIAAGQNGTFARTSNSGATWSVSSIDSNMHVNSIYMKNVNEGFAIGYFGKISRTFDGGNTWTTPISISQQNLHNMTFFTDSIGYIVGGFSSFSSFNPYGKGIIWQTIDAGDTWTVADSSYNDILIAITAVDNNIGYIAGAKGRILKISNASFTGINTIVSQSVFTIFPNPARSEIKMNLLEPNTGTFYLFNTLGELLINTEISGQQNLNIQNIASGIYSYRLICKNGSVVTGKIVIQQ